MNKNKRTRGSAEAAGCVGGGMTCGCWIALMVFNLLIGAWSVNYCLESFLNKTVETWIAMLAGLFLAEITFPLAVVCWLLRLCGVHVPFIH